MHDPRELLMIFAEKNVFGPHLPFKQHISVHKLVTDSKLVVGASGSDQLIEHDSLQILSNCRQVLLFPWFSALFQVDWTDLFSSL